MGEGGTLDGVCKRDGGGVGEKGGFVVLGGGQGERGRCVITYALFRGGGFGVDEREERNVRGHGWHLAFDGLRGTSC